MSVTSKWTLLLTTTFSTIKFTVSSFSGYGNSNRIGGFVKSYSGGKDGDRYATLVSMGVAIPNEFLFVSFFRFVSLSLTISFSLSSPSLSPFLT